jgi:ABC-2 type transport system ATP-binding protein
MVHLTLSSDHPTSPIGIVQKPTDHTTNAALEIKDLCKSFRESRQTTRIALDHLTFSIQRGEIFGLLGPNGSGKTTTINLLSGLSMPTSGTIKVMGYAMGRHTRQAVSHLLGIVPQETALYEELTAWANMDFHADLFGLPRQEKNERIRRMLELVQLLDRKDSRVRTFSGGMKRRLALARALLHEPQLLYLDEPTLGVDVQSRRAIWDYILALRNQGRTILLTTNYLEEAQALCDRLAIIDHGKLLALDTPEHLKQTYGGNVIEIEAKDLRPGSIRESLQALPGVNEVIQNGTHFKITAQGNSHIVGQIITLFSQEGGIRDLSLREPNLDEIFLFLTGAALRD